MRIRIIPVAAAVALLALSGCAAQSQPSAPIPPTGGEPYSAAVTVIDSGSGPNACTVIQESWPPGCGDPLPIEGWDWDDVTGYEQSGETRWGDYSLRGVVTDGVLVLTWVSGSRSQPIAPPPADGGEILQPGHGTGPETGR